MKSGSIVHLSYSHLVLSLELYSHLVLSLELYSHLVLSLALAGMIELAIACAREAGGEQPKPEGVLDRMR